MFGYVRPFRPELKCKDFDLYRATYCGLCRCLRRRYGLIAPMFLNFDFTFLALVLWEGEERWEPCRGRCHANPLVKKTMCVQSPALELAADESIVLAWWKLRDSVQDEGFFGGLPARALSLALAGSYRKAARRVPDFDRTADTLARRLISAARAEVVRGRVLGQLLYHLGRWIYLADARDDLEEDRSAGRYNPVTARYGPGGDDKALALTMDQSLGRMGEALQLGQFGCRTALLENMIYLGLPLVQRAVFDGSWAQIKKQKIWRQDT